MFRPACGQIKFEKDLVSKAKLKKEGAKRRLDVGNNKGGILWS